MGLLSSNLYAADTNILSNIMTQSQYADILTQIEGPAPGTPDADAYDYGSLTKAVDHYQAFDSSSKLQNILELSAYLANAAHETGEFKYMTESYCTNGQGKPNNPLSANCRQSYGCTSDGSKCFYGRGALQLSHDYNYQAYSTAENNEAAQDPDILLPSTVVSDGQNLLFDSALWFWTTSKGQAGTSTIPNYFTGTADPATFTKNDPMGQSIRIINGGIECYPGDVEANHRISLYKKIVAILAKDNGISLDPAFTSGNVGATCTGSTPPAPGLPNQLVLTYDNDSTGGYLKNAPWAAVNCVSTIDTTKTVATVSIDTKTPATGTGTNGITDVTCYRGRTDGQSPVNVPLEFKMNGTNWTTTSQQASCSADDCNFHWAH